MEREWPAPSTGFPTDLRVAWKFNVGCNANCPYCTERNMPTVGLPEMWWTREEAIAAWQRAYEDHGPIAIAFGGREPSLRLHLIGEVLRMGHYGTMSTNLRKEPEEFARQLPADRMSIATSFQPIAWDYDAAEFIRRMLVLQADGFRVTSASIVAWPPFLPRLREWQEQINASGIKCNIHTFHGFWEGRKFPWGYTDEERAVFVDTLNPRKVRLQLEEKAPLISSCLAGMYYLFIPLNGEVRRCLQIEGEIAEQNFYRDPLVFNDAPAPCTTDRCRCNQVWPYHVKEQSLQ